MGIEVTDTETVDAEQSRLAAAGFAAAPEPNTTCCYAVQDKFWVENTPDHERWEIYTVLSDSDTRDGVELLPRGRGAVLRIPQRHLTNPLS